MLLAALFALAHAATPAQIAGEETDEPRSGPLDRPAEGLGVGVLLGQPTGVSLAYKPPRQIWWLDLAVAWAFGSSVQVHADVAVTLGKLRSPEIPGVIWPVWLGAGPRLRVVNTFGGQTLDTGVRIPVGMAVVPERLPFEAFVELVPGLGIIPETRFIFEAGIGARFYVWAPRPKVIVVDSGVAPAAGAAGR